MRPVEQVGADLAVREVANRLGVADRVVYRLVFRGDLDGHPDARAVQVVVSRGAVDRYLARMADGGLWGELRMDLLVEDVLASVGGKDHHFGWPWLTAYQLALGIESRHPDAFARIGKPVGGAGTGEDSLARYLAHQLSRRIKAEGDRYPVEGAFLSDEFLSAMTFTAPGREPITSSLVGSGDDLSLFRLRPT